MVAHRQFVRRIVSDHRSNNFRTLVDIHTGRSAAPVAHASPRVGASGARPGMTEWGAPEGATQDRTKLLPALEAE
jgi:hypothetical protein